MTNLLISGRGQIMTLGKLIGRGGEGAVYEVVDIPGSVAKVYHKPITGDHAAKLSAMVRSHTDRLLKIAAWPTDTLHLKPHGPTVGLIMPRISGHKEIHALYGPKTRVSEFPDADWSFLIHAAANLARAFGVIHDHGHVVGDVNHGNVVVSPRGTVALIDCDSFQIADNGRCFPCEVGVSTHTPPELQGRSFRGVLRTPNHDCFGLAVLIFQLLCMGRHPFSGRFLGHGEMPLERAIQEFRFAYSWNAKQLSMEPPPGTLTLGHLSPNVAGLFERAFSQEGLSSGRPRPQEWILALSTLAGQLQQCRTNPGHTFRTSEIACPWCELEAVTGVAFFNFTFVAVTTPAHGFNLIQAWTQITQVAGPGPGPNLPDRSQITVTPSSLALSAGKSIRNNQIIGLGFIIAAIITAFSTGLPGSIGILIVVLSIPVGISIMNSGAGEARRQVRSQLSQAQSAYQDIERRWQQEAGEGSFRAKVGELEQLKREYGQLPTVRQQKLQALQANLRTAQLHKFLDGFKIDDAKIPGIGPSRKAALQSWGIETADDVILKRIHLVPGFGPKFTSRLLDWRRTIEAQFRFDPTRGLDPKDVARVEREMADRRRKIEEILTRGPSELRQICERIHARRRTLLPILEQALRALVQAETDSRAVG